MEHESVVDFEYFKKLVSEQELPDEKSGFPSSLRKPANDLILNDIVRKLPSFTEPGSSNLDIGHGVSTLSQSLARVVSEAGANLYVVDSPEVLEQVSWIPEFRKIPVRFPDDLDFVVRREGTFDSALMYSVLHNMGVDQNPLDVIMAAIRVCKPGGTLLVGDIPNSSKKGRFLGSRFGKSIDAEYRSRTPEPGQVQFGFARSFDDAALLEIVGLLRAQGHEAFVLPQPNGLPLCYTREDLVVVKRRD